MVEVGTAEEVLSQLSILDGEEPVGVQKEDLLYAEVRRIFHRFLADHGKQRELIKTAGAYIKEKGFSEIDARERFHNRILENTYHPSQILPAKLKQMIWERLRSLRREYRDRPLTLNQIEGIARREALALQGETAALSLDLGHARIRANSKLDATQIDYLKRKVRGLSPHQLEDPHGAIAFLKGYIPSELFLESVYPDEAAVNDFFHHPRAMKEIDEGWETVQEAKTKLLSQVSDTHSVWIDFDGAKRPEAIMFDIMGSALMEDIRSVGRKHFSDVKKRKAIGIFSAHLRISVMIHSLTQVLRDNDLPDSEGLERFMDHLKARRRHWLVKMVKLRNTLERRLSSEGESHVLVSKQIRFLPRLDHKFLEAHRKAKINGVESLTDREKTHLATFQSIQQQIADMNVIALERHDAHTLDQDMEADVAIHYLQDHERISPFIPPVPQVMVANAGTHFEFDDSVSSPAEAVWQDFETLDECFADSPDVVLVPLVEAKATTSRDQVKSFLDRAWKAWGEDKFNRRVKEIFFAGSDLSKEIGQFRALIQVREAALEIEAFNRTHGTDVRIKLGSGEALFRQLGFLDPEGGLPLVRGMVENDVIFNELTGEKRAAADAGRAFLADRFGSDVDGSGAPRWKRVLKRRPSGFHWLLERHPWINAFTEQSRAREEAFLIEPSRFLAMMRDLDRLHQRNFDATHRVEGNVVGEFAAPMQPRLGSFAPTPDYLWRAAEAEERAYKGIDEDSRPGGDLMGSPEDKTKPGQLLSLPALIEIFTKPSPLLRDRALSRLAKSLGLLDEMDHLSESEIDSRAIATNSAANFIYPLGLLGKGALLKQAKKDQRLPEVLHYLPARDTLREMKLYESIAPLLIAEGGLLEQFGMGSVAKRLRVEWELLLSFRPLLQEAFWHQGFGPEVAALSHDDKRIFTTLLVPGTRELLDDDFESRRTILNRENFSQFGPAFLEKGLTHLQQGQALLDAFERSVSAMLTHPGRVNEICPELDLGDRTPEDTRARVRERLLSELQEGASLTADRERFNRSLLFAVLKDSEARLGARRELLEAFSPFLNKEGPFKFMLAGQDRSDFAEFLGTIAFAWGRVG